jgi:hypothetical protein
MEKVLNKVGLISACLLLSISVFGQVASDVTRTGSTNTESPVYVPNFNQGNPSFQPLSFRSNASGIFSFHGNSSMMLFETFMRQMNLKMPSTNYRFVSAKGMNFQAGLMMNSRQPKLGASFSMPRGLSFSAGYGLGSSNLMRPGSMSIGRSPGVQFSASYRLFKGR